MTDSTSATWSAWSPRRSESRQRVARNGASPWVAARRDTRVRLNVPWPSGLGVSGGQGPRTGLLRGVRLRSARSRRHHPTHGSHRPRGAGPGRREGRSVIPGTGTAVNVVAVLVGSLLGVLLGNRLPQRTRDAVTDGLGLVTLMIAATTAADVLSPALAEEVGDSAPLLIVLGAVLLGGIVGSLLRLEQRVEALGGFLQRRLSGETGSAERQRFVQGFVAASLLFCTGPLTILGSLNDGLGAGADQLVLKSALDGFAAIAFAASFGWGVAASALTIVVVQGSLTLVGLGLGDVLPAAHLAAVGAVGGLLLIGIALRLLRIREVPVADLLPALVIAPLLVSLVTSLN
nr:DUF554 domain-containing protein [Nocardioides ochotonae]